MEFDPIGIFRCPQKYPNDAPRQGILAPGSTGTVELTAGRNLETALRGIEGFSHLWLLFHFDRNSSWKPLVLPPRAPSKVGVFASRAPYRPNAIGLSCVRLLGVRDRCLDIAAHDLLDGTPILDIKPYVAYADSIPDAKSGWLDDLEADHWDVSFSTRAQAQLDWLSENGLASLQQFIRRQLSESPFAHRQKRVRRLAHDLGELAYRTWRARFSVEEERTAITVDAIASGYSAEERISPDDPYEDKTLHRRFTDRWPAG